MKQSEVIAKLKSTVKNQIEMVEEFRSLDQAVLSKNPSSESWNALQCVEHLNRYAEFYTKQLESKLRSDGDKTNTGDKEFKPGYWGNKFINGMLPDEKGKIKKMKTFKSKNPSKQETKTDSLDSFQEYQKQWLKILEQAEDFDLNRNKCSLTIPIIKMNLGATLEFVIAHQERHINQAARAIEAVKA